MKSSLYSILGLSPGATPAEIKKAYRKLALLHHPDHNPGNDESAHMFVEIQQAYEILADPVKRKMYDDSKPYPFSASRTQTFEHTFTSYADPVEARCFDELKLFFVYTGEGRFFKKPPLTNFFVTGLPFVSFQKISDGLNEVRQTTFCYIISPLIAGTIEIGKASIRINNALFETEPIVIRVSENICHYAGNKTADGKPFCYRMVYQSVTGSEKTRVMKNVNHAVLVPRSRYAQSFHTAGALLKFFFMAWGAVLSFYSGFSFIAGTAGGLLFGGIACRGLYRLGNVKPLFMHSANYPVVKEYLEKGYSSGTDSGSRFISSEWVYRFIMFLT